MSSRCGLNNMQDSIGRSRHHDAFAFGGYSVAEDDLDCSRLAGGDSKRRDLLCRPLESCAGVGRLRWRQRYLRLCAGPNYFVLCFLALGVGMSELMEHLLIA
jgi:hypothetical protein